MHEIALDVRISICTPENKKMTIGNIAAVLLYKSRPKGFLMSFSDFWSYS